MNRLAFLLPVLFSFTTAAQPTSDREGEISTGVDEERIDQIFSEWNRPGSPGCAVGVYRDGKLVFSKGYGEAVPEDHIPVTPRTVFYAGSLSKQFTAAAIVLLSLEGKVELDRPVRDYISEIPEYETEPTVRQLIHHTSGLPDLYALLGLYDISLTDVVPFEKLVAVIAGQSHLNFEPGSSYSYSNSGYTLLAELVERVSGQTLRAYTAERLFEPLGMHNTHFHDDRHHVIERKALSYQPGGKTAFKLSYLPNFEGVGPGGLYTTVEDLLKWDQQLRENQLPGAEGFNELMTRRGILNNGDTLSYAAGLVVDAYKGQRSVAHGGSFMGFKADFLQLPEHGYGSAILCNLGNIDPGSLNRELADVFLEAPFEEWLSKYTGTYYSEALKLEYTLQLKEANLYLDRKNAPSGKLTYAGGHTFRTGSWELTFSEPKPGKVTGFTISSGRARNISFVKKSRREL